MNRFLRYASAALVLAVVVGGGTFVLTHRSHVTLHGLRLPRGCESYSCLDFTLDHLLQGGAVTAQIANKNPLLTAKGKTVTDTRASARYCRKTSAFDPAQLQFDPENFGSSSWANNSSVITADTDIAPDGTLSADRLSDLNDAANTFHSVQNFTNHPTTAAWTASVFAKYRNSTCIDVIDGNGGVGAVYNLQTGTVSSTHGSGVTGTITTSTNGFYRLSTFMPTGGSSGADYFIILNPACQAIGGANGYVANGSSVVIWGAKMENGALTGYVSPQLVSLGSNVACVESTGLIPEGSASNLYVRTRDLSNAAWTKNLATVTASAALAPDDTLSSWFITDNSTSGFHGIYHSGTLSGTGVPVTVSAYARAGTSSCAAIFDGANGHGATFNLTTGTVVATNGGWTGAVLEGSAAGFWRISTTGTTSSTTTDYWIMVNQPCGSPGSGYSGTGSTIELAFPQLESGLFATSYIDSPVSAAGTRSTEGQSTPTTLTGSNWCLSFTMTPEHAAWNAAVARFVVALGGISGPNVAWLQDDGSSLTMHVHDAASAEKFWFAAVPSGGIGTSHRISICDASGVASIAYDGVAQSLTSGGSGTGSPAFASPNLLTSIATVEPDAWFTDYCLGVGACP